MIGLIYTENGRQGMRYRIEVVIHTNGTENVVLYFGEKQEATFCFIIQQLTKQGYVLKITAEVEE